MCDFACGLSRTLSGQVIPSERKEHVILETWNPLGVIGVISAFNFPHAVFGWNLCLALITGNAVVWKGSQYTGLVTMATNQLVQSVLSKHKCPEGLVMSMVGSGSSVGNLMINDRRI